MNQITAAEAFDQRKERAVARGAIFSDLDDALGDLDTAIQAADSGSPAQELTDAQTAVIAQIDLLKATCYY